jgi:hypothetical protein
VSCAEWCLSKPSGACIQIYVNLRKNGSSLLLGNCTNPANKTCFGLDQENAAKLRCIKEDCKNLSGMVWSSFIGELLTEHWFFLL